MSPNPSWPLALWLWQDAAFAPVNSLNSSKNTKPNPEFRWIKVESQSGEPCDLFPRCLNFFFIITQCVWKQEGWESFPLTSCLCSTSVWMSVSLRLPLSLCVYSHNSTWKISIAGHRGALGSVINANSRLIWNCPRCSPPQPLLFHATITMPWVTKNGRSRIFFTLNFSVELFL